MWLAKYQRHIYLCKWQRLIERLWSQSKPSNWKVRSVLWQFQCAFSLVMIRQNQWLLGSLGFAPEFAFFVSIYWQIHKYSQTSIISPPLSFGPGGYYRGLTVFDGNALVLTFVSVKHDKIVYIICFPIMRISYMGTVVKK